MSRDQWNRIEELFAEVIALPPGERARWLDRRCAAEPDVRRELDSLLRAHEESTGPLDQPPAFASTPAPPAGQLTAGTRLGPWQVLNLIGRGGAGEVYAAVRADGEFHQKVAIKLLHQAALAEFTRFRSEREILARLEHPGIARLLDGGVYGSAQPYTVMEHVEGQPLTEYCRVARLGLTGRLKLFNEVCNVVSHAHRALVVHRDLKPGNILVTAAGRVKLLDFGVAKLLDTLATPDPGDLTFAPLTPDYAAPEQFTGQAITTATDIYALGVVLFELLTDRRPWRSAQLPVAQAVRTVVDTQAPAPSAVARLRDDSPVPAGQLAGDLDAIVAKCLRKEPEHRYESVNALERDVQRFLSHEPVGAREGAKLYVLGRLLRRHRWGVAAVTALVLALTGGMAATSWQAHRAALERDIAKRAAAREEAVRYYLARLFRTSVSERGPEPTTAKTMLDRTAHRVLSEYRDDPYLAGKVMETLADLYAALEDPEGMAPLLEGFLAQAGPEADPEALALARQKLANVELLRGHVPRAAELLKGAETFWITDPRRYAEQRLEGLVVRGRLQRAQGDLTGSIATYEAAIRERVALSGRNHAETATLYNSLAITYTAANRLDDALKAYEQAVAIHEALGRAEDLDALIMRANMGTLDYRLGRLAEAQSQLRNAYERQRALSGDSAAVAAAMGYYGSIRSLLGDDAEALKTLRAAVSMATEFAGAASPVALTNRLFLGEALAAAGDAREAATILAENLDLAGKQLGGSHLLVLRTRLAQVRLGIASGDDARADGELAELDTALRALGAPAVLTLTQTLIARGNALIAENRAASAVPLLTEALQMREKLLWEQSWEVAEARQSLGEALAATQDPRARALLESARAVLESQLGPHHPLTLRARRATST